MLTGFGGHLVSEAFLEQSLLAAAEDERLTARQFREQFIKWRRACAALGPAASLRTLLEVGAAPLIGTLAFDGPTEVELKAEHAAATLHQNSGRAALLVTVWAAPLGS